MHKVYEHNPDLDEIDLGNQAGTVALAFIVASAILVTGFAAGVLASVLVVNIYY